MSRVYKFRATKFFFAVGLNIFSIIIAVMFHYMPKSVSVHMHRAASVR